MKSLSSSRLKRPNDCDVRPTPSRLRPWSIVQSLIHTICIALPMGWGLSTWGQELPGESFSLPQSWEWRSGGNFAWQPDERYVVGGNPVWRSGPIGHGGASWLELSLRGHGTLTFYMKVDSELGYDTMRFTIDQVLREELSGMRDWARFSYPFAGDAHILNWTYGKDLSTSHGADAAWVGGFSWSPVPREWAGLAADAQGWTHLSGFGVFMNRGNWIFHSQFGWLYGVDLERDGFLLAVGRGQREIDWYWTNTGVFPWVYRFNPPARWRLLEAQGIEIDAAGLVHVAGGRLAEHGGMPAVAAEDFFMGQFEVTWGEWKEVRDWAVGRGYDLHGVGAGCRDDHPVHSVNWHDILKWCNARSEMEGLVPAYSVNGQVYRTGQAASMWNVAERRYDFPVQWNRLSNGYRVPTAEEWQFAARGGNLSKGYMFSGSDELNRVAWNRTNSMNSDCDLTGGFNRGTHPVGRKEPNELGLYDMSGNVHEWAWAEYMLLEFSPEPFPLYGGGWNSDSGGSELATTFRYGRMTGVAGDNDAGFRLARSHGVGLADETGFIRTPVGETVTGSIFISNLSTGNLQILGVDYPEGFNGDFEGGVLSAGEIVEIIVSFSPQVAGDYIGDLVVMTDFVFGEDRFFLPLHGSGVLDEPEGFATVFSGTLNGRYGDDINGLGGRMLVQEPVDAFFIGEHPVTWGEWKRVRDWALLNGYSTLNGVGVGAADDHPVHRINYFDAAAWCNAKSEMEGLDPVYWVGGSVFRGSGNPTGKAEANGYRLPTQLEWWFAAAGGNHSRGYRFAGSDNLDAVGWYLRNALSAESGSRVRTAPVGLKQPNELGLYDMSGNVLEWTLWEINLGNPGGAWDLDFGLFPDRTMLVRVNSMGERERPHTDGWYSNYGMRLARNHETGGEPRFLSFSENLQFGTVVVGDFLELELTLFNEGSETLTVSDIELPEGFSADWTSGTIAPGGSQVVVIRFEPQTNRVHGGLVVVRSDATRSRAPARIEEVRPILNFQLVEYVKVAGDPDMDTFWISPFEVTWGEWKHVRDWAVANGYDIGNLGHGCGDDHPVQYVPWYAAVKWCNAKTEMENALLGRNLAPAYLVDGEVFRTGSHIPTWDRDADGYRLPAHAEWVYAATGGELSEGFDFSGSDVADEVGWFGDNSAGAPCGDTWPVGLKLPNELGLYDMSGNVREWCWETRTHHRPSLSDIYYGETAGGAYNDNEGALRPNASMRSMVRGEAHANVGFRPVRTHTGETEMRFIALSGDLHFGEVAVGESATLEFVIENTGTGTLTVYGIDAPAGFSAHWSGTIAPGASHTVPVTFTPGHADPYLAELAVDSNAHNPGYHTIGLTGNLGSPVRPFGGDPNAVLWEEVNERWVRNYYANGFISMTDREYWEMWFYDASALGMGISSDVRASVAGGRYGGYENWSVASVAVMQDMFFQQHHFINVQPARYKTGSWGTSFGLPNMGYRRWVNMLDGSVGQALLGPMWLWPMRWIDILIELEGDLVFEMREPGTGGVGKYFTIHNPGDRDLEVTGITLPFGFFGNWSGTIAGGESREIHVLFIPDTHGMSYGGNLTVHTNATVGSSTLPVRANAEHEDMPAGGDNRALRWEELDDEWIRNEYADGAVTLTDRFTGLTWHHDASALGAVRRAESQPVCEQLEYAGFTDWFLPHVEDLEPIFDVRHYFEGLQPDRYWTSSFSGTIWLPHVYFVNMENGRSGSIRGERGYEWLEEFWVLPCRGGGTSMAVPANFAFGSTYVGASTEHSFVITNDGDGHLAINGIAYPEGVTGPNWYGLIGPGEQKTLTVAFTPTEVKAYSGQIIVYSNRFWGTSRSNITGNGLEPIPIIEVAGDLNFGEVVLGKAVSRTLTVRNKGYTEMEVSGISYPEGFLGEDFSGNLPVGGQVELEVTFQPNRVQLYSGQIVLSSNALSGTGAIAAQGRGIETPQISGSRIFFETDVGKTSTRRLTVTNQGTEPWEIERISYSEGFSGDFSAVIPVGVSFEFEVTFTPSTGGLYEGTMTIHSGGAQGNYLLTLTGFGATRVLALSGDPAFGDAAALDFGEVALGESKSLPLYISNTGNRFLRITGFTTTPGYSVELGGNLDIDPGAIRQVMVRFSPVQVFPEDGRGLFEGEVNVISNATGGMTSHPVLAIGTDLDSSADAMVYVEGGTLEMSTGMETVESFYIGRYEVTWGEWRRVREWAADNGYDIGDRGAGCEDFHPVHTVTWYDAVKWCNAKSEMEGLTPVYSDSGTVYRSGYRWNIVISQNLSANGYRLPLYTEWEFAARGGNQTNGYTYAGSDDPLAVGWFNDNSNGAVCNLSVGRGTWPVGWKAPNELGLYDMSGNVREWCWAEGAGGASILVPGGSWNSWPSHPKLSDPENSTKTSSNNTTGFRLVRVEGTRTVGLSGNAEFDPIQPLDFGEVAWRERKSLALYIRNTGTHTLRITGFDLPPHFFVEWDGYLEIPPGVVRELSVSFSPKELFFPGAVDGRLLAMGNLTVIAHSAGGTTTLPLTAIGTGVYPTTHVMVPVEGGTLEMSMGTETVASFYIGRYAVTLHQWRRVREWAAANGYDIGERGAGCADEHPVHTVSWYDVVKWCNAKSEMEGLTPVYTVSGSVYRSGEPDPSQATIMQNLSANGYRLPLEAEWEFAARGGNQTNGYTYSGSNDLNAVGWYRDNSGGAACNLSSGRGTWPVGQKFPNELGLYDMSGNVWEWCWDRLRDDSSFRRFRGGSWNFSAGLCSVSYRSAYSPVYRDFNGGFRLARTVSAPSP